MMNLSAGKQPSVMKHNFSQVPQADIPRSQFNRSHGFKTTFDSGYIVPCFVDEALPGDTFNLKMTTFARLATPIVPVMDNMYCDSFFFAVPYRLVWSHWEQFNGQQANPGDSTSYLIPQAVAPASTGYAVNSLQDYMGLPTGIPGFTHSNLWLRAYNLIWNEWFRDQNLQNSVTVDMGDGPDTPANYTLLRRGKRHDYFTSCLPWPQKGPSVPIPLGGKAPISGIGKVDQDFLSANEVVWEPNQTATSTFPWSSSINYAAAPSDEFFVRGTAQHLGTPDIYADLTQATAATINALRQSFQIQRLYERDARGGTRYTEIIRSHFGVVSPDARLQRPEYLGGGSTPISFTPIPQTAATGTTPQGNLAAISTVQINNHGFVKSFTEHCLLLGFISVRADLNYQQGLNRMWSRQSRFDFYWPALSHIGEQAVLNQEIYTQGTANPTQDAAVFGYQERYAEYRYKPSLITGEFRSTYSTPLDIWHLAQKFTTLPTLSTSFIQENPPVARVIAVTGAPQFMGDFYFNLTCARPMPTYSVPGLIDHF